MRPTVLLFDIDGTLVTCGGAGRRAMERAFAEALTRSGRPSSLAREVSDFPYGGMTDRAIARDGLVRSGIAVDDGVIDALLCDYLAFLADELPRSTGYRALDGVHALLDDLEPHRDRELAIGLGTGNLVPGAELKLRPAGLWERFDFGGYGSDHEDRTELLAHGARRGAERLGRERREVEVVVIGDTPRDVWAARAIGARCVAVASGSYDRPTLAAERPDVVLDSLVGLTRETLLG